MKQLNFKFLKMGSLNKFLSNLPIKILGTKDLYVFNIGWLILKIKNTLIDKKIQIKN